MGVWGCLKVGWLYMGTWWYNGCTGISGVRIGVRGFWW